jgi:hypothetical protein
MNDRPKRNTQAGEAPQRATSGQNGAVDKVSQQRQNVPNLWTHSRKN